MHVHHFIENYIGVPVINASGQANLTGKDIFFC